MPKDPAILFYTSDFLTGTFSWTNDQVGAYIRLLCLQHQKGGLTEDEIKSICGASTYVVQSKFERNGDGLFYNQRMREETVKRSNFCESRRKSIQARYVRNTYEVRMENENAKKELKTKNNNNINSISLFEIIYAQYPKKIGKKKALRHFQASIKNEQDVEQCKKALANYLASKRVYNGFVMNADTWFNNWQDWITQQDPLCPKCKGAGKFISSTGYEIVCDCTKKGIHNGS